MNFLIRTIDTTAAGREIVRERTLQQDGLVIGRAATCDIHLPDLAIEQEHVRIAPGAAGLLQVEAIGGLGFGLDGRTVENAIIDPGEGAELALGSALIVVAKEDDGTPSLTIRQRESTEGKADVLQGFALAGTLPSKRAMAWGLLAAIVLAFLAIPISSHLARERIEPDEDQAGQVALDSAWSTGALSLAHHGLEDNCEACHVDAFVAVRDETCLTCHDDIGDHAAGPRLAFARGPMDWGEGLQWAVADLFGKEGPGACTTCHTEHEGATRMEPASQQFCADCHGSLDTRLTDTALGNAQDFGKAHPQFRPAIFTELRRDETRRISLASKPKEQSGLKFPHDVHLDPQSGVARMAISLGRGRGYGKPLTCTDCHAPDADGVGFAPVEMEDNCESCHSLVYDRVGGTYRTLRHGDVAQMQADLIAMDRAPRRPVVTGRKRPGQFARGGLYYQDFGPPNTSLVGVDRALAPGGVCGECHLPATKAGRPDVVPVNLSDSFLIPGTFDHAEHKQEKCTSCHDATNSDTSEDLLLPGIATCRECHQGEQAIRAEVPSSCALCHSYHDDHAGEKRDGKRRIVNAALVRE